ncbi:MAG: hypothetical protein V7L23_08455 [Nostoc sp.]|uniref:hypothetical protein n=1 Tax=Nostoc sp. TaxID=1180 RepID=UPI002FF2F493
MLKACACAGEQGSRGAGEQGSRGEFNVPCSFPSAPLPLCPSAFQTCEKCGVSLARRRYRLSISLLDIFYSSYKPKSNFVLTN